MRATATVATLRVLTFSCSDGKAVPAQIAVVTKRPEDVLSRWRNLEFNVPMAGIWHAGWRQSTEGSGVVLGFSLPSRDAVDRRYADLTEAGYVGRQQPYDAFWSARYAVIQDPDGNAVGLMSPIDAAKKYTQKI